MKRRKFIQLNTALVTLGLFMASCKTKRKIPGKIIGASADRGHLIRDKQWPSPADYASVSAVVIGGGISGLSATRFLRNAGMKDLLLLELENETGGNAASGVNEVSAFPWGAHYIPLPNNDLPEYHQFLAEAEVLLNYDQNGLPVYNEHMICFDPEERLYINGRWQDGLIPKFGVPEDDLRQIKEFLSVMEQYRYAKGADGKEAFAIPVNRSSADTLYTALDKLTMKAWMEQRGWTSEYLHTYVNYCCRDDFGTPHKQISAWAGIHYFASRKGKAVNAGYADVLTWPEGNSYLAGLLRRSVSEFVLTGSMAVNVQATDKGVKVDYLDVATGAIKGVIAQQCILAVPQFVSARLLKDTDRQQLIKQHFSYSPWMVANLKVNELEERSGAGASWDNVLFGNESLGYVDATHQQLRQYKPVRNLTYYLPLTQLSPVEERKLALARTHNEWTELVLGELEKVHPDIRTQVEEMNIMLWGHAMTQPLPGMIHGGIRQQLAMSPDPRIHFAHTDLAGISIFEEAFYQGIEAAKQAIRSVD